MRFFEGLGFLLGISFLAIVPTWLLFARFEKQAHAGIDMHRVSEDLRAMAQRFVELEARIDKEIQASHDVATVLHAFSGRLDSLEQQGMPSSAPSSKGMPGSAASVSLGLPQGLKEIMPALDDHGQFKSIIERTTGCAHEDFGGGLTERWRGTGKVVCSGGTSSITEYSLVQARHSGPDYTFKMSHVRFNVHDGSFTAHCNPSSDFMSGNGRFAYKFNVQDGLQPWLRALSFTASPLESAASGGVASFDVTPTLIVPQRDCRGPPYNLYHCSADAINAITTAEIFEIPRSTLRVFFLDAIESDPMWWIWNSLAGAGVYTTPTRTQLIQSEYLYLEHVYLNVNAGGALIWKDGPGTPCKQISPILNAFARTAATVTMGVVNLVEATHAQPRKVESKASIPGLPRPPLDLPELPAWSTSLVSSLAQPKTRNILVASRNNAKYRRLLNEDAVVRALAERLPQYNVIQQDLGQLPFLQQVKLVNSVTGFVGMHGAAMAHILFVQKPHEFNVVEVFQGPDDHPHFYENFCVWVGCHSYAPFVHQGRKEDMGVTVDVQALVAVVQQMMQNANH